MSNYLNKIVYVTEAQLQTLLAGGTVSGHTYNENNIYITPKGTATVDNNLQVNFNDGTSNIAQYIFNGSEDKIINLVAGDNINMTYNSQQNKVVVSAQMHTLTFGAGGNYQYDGTADLTVPVYTGTIYSE